MHKLDAIDFIIFKKMRLSNMSHSIEIILAHKILTACKN